ncbi:inorganic pyrophosphatase [Lacticaseibacillus paracasei]|uniref:inorganic pyrophosphatase n=1 Tax=Lacticaseibacillus paracasei TaxID=1597 RepID=UPI0034A261CE
MASKSVFVKVDRPIGFSDKSHAPYPINYGYVPTVTGGDGEKQDVYIVVHRADDNEEKWVATTENETFSAAEIAARIHFMEQYFDSTVRLI